MDRDTTPEQRQCYYDILCAQSLQKKAEMLSGLCAGVRTMAEAGIHLRHPGATTDEVRRRLAVRLYGRDVAQRVLGDVPDDAR